MRAVSSLVKMAALITEAVSRSVAKVNAKYRIKSKQLECIQNLLKGQDTLAILPTSCGKSMIYQLLPSIFKLLPSQPDNAIVIVFSPLRALILDQVTSANNISALGLRACGLAS